MVQVLPVCRWGTRCCLVQVQVLMQGCLLVCWCSCSPQLVKSPPPASQPAYLTPGPCPPALQYSAFEDTQGVYLVTEFASRGDVFAEVERKGGRWGLKGMSAVCCLCIVCASMCMHLQVIMRHCPPAMAVWMVQCACASVHFAE